MEDRDDRDALTEPASGELTKAPAVVWASSRIPAPLAFALAMVVSAITVLPFPRLLTDGLRLFAFAFVVLAAIPVRVRIGPDALAIAWIGRATLLRYENIVRASPLGNDVIILLKGGGVVRLLPALVGGTRPQVLLTRLWDVLSAGAESGVRPAERARLVRARKSSKEWVDELRSLTLPGQQYRQNIDHERLWTLANNPAVEPEIRIGAAIAVAAVFDGAARERLRALAREAMDERMGQTFARIAEAEDITDLQHAVERSKEMTS